jgi:nucleoside-diphosphate-sugar epimerase
VNVCDLQSLTQAIEKNAPTEIVHLAASTDFDAAAALSGFPTNSEGIANVLTALSRTQARCRLFCASTMLVSGASVDDSSVVHGRKRKAVAYGKSKAVGERLIHAAPPGNFTWVIGRLTSIWGPWFGEPYRPFFELVERGMYASPAKSSATKTFGYVENTVHQIDRLLLQADSAIHGQTLYLGDDPAIDIADWADAIAAAFGVGQPRRLPLALFRAGAIAGDLLAMAGVRLPMTTFRLRNMTTDNVVDLGPIDSLAGPGPVRLEEGIRRTIDWLRSHR